MEQTSLPLHTGKELRDAGIAQVEANNLEWKDRALNMVRKMRNSAWQGEKVTGEEIKWLLRGWGLEEPTSQNAWGGLIFRCVHAGLLVDTGRSVHMKNPSARSRRNPVWKFT